MKNCVRRFLVSLLLLVSLLTALPTAFAEEKTKWYDTIAVEYYFNELGYEVETTLENIEGEVYMKMYFPRLGVVAKYNTANPENWLEGYIPGNKLDAIAEQVAQKVRWYTCKRVEDILDDEYGLEAHAIIKNYPDGPDMFIFFPEANYGLWLDAKQVEGQMPEYMVEKTDLEMMLHTSWAKISRKWSYSLTEVCDRLYQFKGFGMPIVRLVFTEGDSAVLEYTLDDQRMAYCWQMLDAEEPFWRIESGTVKVSGTVVADLLEQLLR